MKYDPDLAKKINAQKSPKPEGSGKPKETKPPITSPNMQYQFLPGDAGKQVHEAIQDKYKGIEAVTKVVYDDKAQVVKGSNPFYVVAVNEQLREIKDRKLRTATMADLERILKTNALPLRGQYEDAALVWHSNFDPNSYLAENISREAKSKGLSLTEGIPFVFPLYALSLKQDRDSPHKLSFILLNPELCFQAPILASVSQRKFKSSDVEEAIGLPKQVRDDGSRILYTRNLDSYGDNKMHGLSGLYLSRSLIVSSDREDLASSNENGRVVVCDEVADAKNL